MTRKEINIIQSITPVKKSKHNYKLSEEDKNNITLEYYLNRSKQSIKELCNKYNVSSRTIYSIVKKEKYQSLVNDYITECKKNFTKKTTILIDKAIDKLEDKIENDDANIKDLTTTIGILYDKNRLENNLSTSNNAISINIKVEK